MEVSHPPKIITSEQVLNPGLKLGTKEIPLKNGEIITLPFFHIDKMKLFHGSPDKGFKRLKAAEETTAGAGVYLASQKESARGYALVRQHRGNNPTVYEAEISNMDIANLSALKTLRDFSKLFRESLVDWSVNKFPFMNFRNEVMKHVWENILERQLEMIDSGKIRHIKDLAEKFGPLVSDTLAMQGFDGLMALEGGESGHGINIGEHDSYVIFDPEKVKVIKEEAA